MSPNNVKAVAAEPTRPNRLLVALAAAWMILSLAIGGVLGADAPAEAATPTTISSTTAQP